jgi:hypothetical protein
MHRSTHRGQQHQCRAHSRGTWHIPALLRIAFGGHAFVYFQLTQIETIPKHEAQHCLRGASGGAGECFKAALLRRAQCQRSHAACSSLDQCRQL